MCFVLVVYSCTTNSCSKMAEGVFNFTPSVFLRCHSKTDKESADVQTQVWQATFKPKKNSPIISTCGGNKVCLINVSTGVVEQRYTSKDTREIFYTVTWGVLQGISKRYKVLVAGGVRCTLHFIYPKEHIMFLELKLTKKNPIKNNTIASLIFHPTETNILFCATNKGYIYCYKMKVPEIVSDSEAKLMFTLSTGNEITMCAFCKSSRTLFAATEDGLKGWRFDNISEGVKPKLLRFWVEQSANSMSHPKYSTNLVDSVEVIGNGFVCAKWALRGLIYIWDMTVVYSQSSKTEFNISPKYVLRWSETDNYYMGISANLDAGILTCGDDKGHLWLYNLHDILIEPDEESKIMPNKILKWPILNDRFVAKSRKLDLDTYDIIIAKAAVHSSGNYIVAITNNNLVCIWKLESTDDEN